MLATIGVGSLDELIDTTVPASIRSADRLDLPEPLTEREALDALRAIARRNELSRSMIGQGYYGTEMPAVIQRNILENPAWYTAYTPYQPEISQGRLEALLNFQTMVCDLTGTDVANSSLLDEATAAAEAMTMCRRQSKVVGAFFVDQDAHPQVIEVIRTRAEPIDIEVIVGDPAAELHSVSVFGALLAYPGSSGAVRDHTATAAALHDAGAIVVVAADLLALTVLAAPGEWGADIVVGSAQRFGVPLGFGGPHAGFMGVKDPMKRTMPGRLVGMSVDAAGRPAARLALQTREQHIRREKATSNICTAQVLLAVLAGMYATYHGPEGLQAIAARVHAQTTRLAAGLRGLGLEIANEHWFDTLTINAAGRATAVADALEGVGIDVRRVSADQLGISCDELTTPTTVNEILETVAATVDAPGAAGDGADSPAGWRVPDALVRTDPILTHEVFHRYRTETEMLRYLRKLADRDLALDRTMIPLGSCTMKLNATTEMIPVTWPEFATIHPLGPAQRSAGYRDMIGTLEGWLAKITGYDKVSVQPNAGSQGELAGLLAIRAYHRSRGDLDRTVCLIPSSAHGTNAASAVMAGMKVVVVACDEDGNVDLADLAAKVADLGSTIAAIMVTYPSTHGVFEDGIGTLCDMIHEVGGQVYVDGANLNALVGLARPGAFGGDVSHLNLHKTFCIPHGGGGPGVGPVAVRAHLAPFLPGRADATPADGAVGPVSAATYGSASILPISWTYIAMMGADGLTAATTYAILSANYLAARLGDAYPVLYRGKAGRVAHECILDIRPIAKEHGIDNEDIAKRLIDYGFHAPTMSFPVPGTLMIEPTESESLAELDRFCDAMLAIRDEIGRVAAGDWPVDDNPLVNAPHTAADVCTDDWAHAYPRSIAGFPADVDSFGPDKYWPPVSRIDGGFGDRNLVCTCPPPEAFEE